MVDSALVHPLPDQMAEILSSRSISSEIWSANFSQSGETRQDNDLVALRGASVCPGFDEKVCPSRCRQATRSPARPAGLGRRRTRLRWAFLHTFGSSLSLVRAIDGVNRAAPQGTGTQDSFLNLRDRLSSLQPDPLGCAGDTARAATSPWCASRAGRPTKHSTASTVWLTAAAWGTFLAREICGETWLVSAWRRLSQCLSSPRPRPDHRNALVIRNRGQ